MTETTGQVCKECAAPLVRKGRGPAPTYCSAACRAKAGYKRSREDGRYAASLAESKAKNEARRKAEAKPCPYCGDPMTHPRRVQCGKPECKRLWTNERNLAWQRKYKAAAGQWYHRNHAEKQRMQKRRVYLERKERGEPTSRQLYPETHANKDARRRARKAGAKTERFTRREIYERDRWICGICRKRVDPDLTWPHPMSKSLDHVIPISQGGDHTRANCRLAHVICNLSRGDRGGGEQLVLIG